MNSVHENKAVASKKKISLHIGINYTGTMIALRGCHTDAKNMEKLCKSKGYLTTCLIDSPGYIQPTKRNIETIFQELCSSLVSGDCFTISYSGHGTQKRDTNGDEKSGYDQCICPLDMNLAGVILDDFLYSVISKIPSGVKFFAFFDCCHSGTVLDFRYNYSHEGKSFVEDSNHKVTSCEALLFSGCGDPGTSADAFIDGIPCGAFTWALLSVISVPNQTGVAIIRQIAEKLRKSNFSQRPQLSSGNSSRTAFDIINFQ